MSQRTEAKTITHERIVASAGRLILQEGLAAASVPRVMRGAGLTVGGFYAHFRSKCAMLAEVLRKTCRTVRAFGYADIENYEGIDWLAQAVNQYLSPAHRDSPGCWCPWVAILSELPHADEETREAGREELEIDVQMYAAHAPETSGISARERALATLALCAGGMAMARAMRGHPVSDEILQACRKWALPETQGLPTLEGRTDA